MDKIAGGLADKKKPSDFRAKELKAGKKVEREHTNDPDVACEIAMDHLQEIPDYYTRLGKMEREAKRQGATKSLQGEGSRGGVVVGHTKSGSPIYIVKHRDQNMAISREGPRKFTGSMGSVRHFDSAERAQKHIDKYGYGDIAHVANLHEHTKVVDHQSGFREVTWKSLQGEGSRGGRVIGHTRTGKPIYEHGSHEMHLTPEEHHDAARAHESQVNWHRAGAQLAREEDMFDDETREKYAKEHEVLAEYHMGRALRQKAKAGQVSKSLDGEVASIAVVSGTKLLMGVRRDCGRWTLPGGHIEPGEDPRDGAIRELREETGIHAHDLNYMGSEEVTTFTGKRYLIHAFMMTAEPATTTVNDPDREVFGWTWVNLENGLPDLVADNLHSPRNLTLRLMGLQRSIYYIPDLVKGSEGQMMPGHKYIRRYKSHTGEWVYVYHENHAPHHKMSAGELDKFKQLAELGNVQAKGMMDSVQDYHNEHLSLLRELADIGNRDAKEHLSRMGIDREAEKAREDMERQERMRREKEAARNPFTATLSDADHTKAIEAVKKGVNDSVFGYLSGHTTTVPFQKLQEHGVTIDKIMEGLAEQKSIKKILEKLHENLKLIDTAHRGVVSANSAANSAGGYGNLGYNTAIENLKRENLLPNVVHRRSQDSHSVPVDEWKHQWDREAADRQRRAEEERTRAAREAEAAERRRAGVRAFHGSLAHHIMTLAGKTDERMDIDELSRADEMLTKFYGGRRPTKEDWPYDFSDKGVEVKIRSVSFDHRGANFYLEAKKDGRSITNDWQRQWSVGTDGHPEIYNSILIVDSNFRGSGVNLGAMVNAGQIKMLKAIDPRRGTLKVTAALGVGGYNWANQPFSFASDSERRGLVNDFARVLERESGVRLTEAQKELFKYPCHIAAFDDGKTYVKDVRDSMSLSDKQKETNSIICVPGKHPLTNDERTSGKTRRVACHIGKYFLLGNSWSGVAEMKNMNENHGPYKYFKKYAELKRQAYTALDQPYVSVVEEAKAKVASRAAGAPPPSTAPPTTPASTGLTAGQHYINRVLSAWSSRTEGNIRMTEARWRRVRTWRPDEIEYFLANARLTRDARAAGRTILEEARRR